jgi:hypothetical protein
MALAKSTSIAIVAVAALFSSSALAAPPPKEGCRPVSGIEYNAAKTKT